MKKPHGWLNLETVLELRDQLNAAGLEPGLEFDLKGTELTLQVLGTGETPTRKLEVGAQAVRQFRPLNDSHWCPPDCE